MSLLLERSTESLQDELIFCAFVTIALSQLRISEVLSLKVDDLYEDKARNITSVWVSTKTDGSGFREVHLLKEVHRLLTAVMGLTDDVRSEAPASLKDYLFLYRSRSFEAPSLLSLSTFGRRLAERCAELGIERIGARSIRRRYQTEVVMRTVKDNLDILKARHLTGHSSLRTTYEYYVRPDVRQFYEISEGVLIGVPRLVGTIEGTEKGASVERSLTADSLVEGGAGYCRNDSCNIAGTLPCLMCKGFYTTPRCIPEMQEALEIVKRKLRDSAAYSHERERLLAVKRLYVEYLVVMESMRLDESEGKAC